MPSILSNWKRNNKKEAAPTTAMIMLLLLLMMMVMMHFRVCTSFKSASLIYITFNSFYLPQFMKLLPIYPISWHFNDSTKTKHTLRHTQCMEYTAFQLAMRFDLCIYTDSNFYAKKIILNFGSKFVTSKKEQKKTNYWTEKPIFLTFSFRSIGRLVSFWI